jgi:hypothetical protein
MQAGGDRFGCQHQDYRTVDKIVDYWLRAHLPVDMGGGGRHARGSDDAHIRH